jgi:hypothetical protein
MMLQPRTDVSINGLPLPVALLRAMAEQRWRSAPESLVRRVFRENPVRLMLHDLDEMRRANARWLEETNPAFFGHADERLPPGDIDRTLSVIIGGLGPDLPFALDYRTSIEQPSVLYLHSGGDRWIRVARHMDELLARLRLDARRPA